jgi:hypothetical protein
MRWNKFFIFFSALSLAFFACEENELNPGGGKVTPVELKINVTDVAAAGPAVGATVDLYATLSDYVSEVNAIASKDTDADGNVVFTEAELGDVAGRRYVNISLGSKRNWAYASQTPVMNLTAGTTLLKTSVAAVLPQFISLAGNRFALTSYTYGGTNIIDPGSGYGLDPCRADDEFVFLKTGRIYGYDDGVACAPSHPKGYTVAGVDWSSWTLNAAGTTINMKDLDPDWYGSAASIANYTAGLTISGDGNTVTIDYGGGYVATLVKL